MVPLLDENPLSPTNPGSITGGKCRTSRCICATSATRVHASQPRLPPQHSRSLAHDLRRFSPFGLTTYTSALQPVPCFSGTQPVLCFHNLCYVFRGQVQNQWLHLRNECDACPCLSVRLPPYSRSVSHDLRCLSLFSLTTCALASKPKLESHNS